MSNRIGDRFKCKFGKNSNTIEKKEILRGHSVFCTGRNYEIKRIEMQFPLMQLAAKFTKK